MNIIVTGASRGVGNALVKKLAVSGSHHIIAIARDAAKLDALAETCRSINAEVRVEALAHDLSMDNYASELVPRILKHFKMVDALVNNAGLLIKKPFAEMEDEDFDRLFDVNVRSAFRLSRHLLPFFNKPAHIVNISSMGGVQGSVKFPGLTLYSAAKGALAVLTEAMAEELKDHEVRVNCLAFGAVQTEMLQSAFPGYKAPNTADEMAEFVADFVLNGHKYFNGKILPVSSSTP